MKNNNTARLHPTDEDLSPPQPLAADPGVCGDLEWAPGEFAELVGLVPCRVWVGSVQWEKSQKNPLDGLYKLGILAIQ